MRSDLVAIDIHTHPSTELMLAHLGKRREQMAKYFRRERPAVSLEQMAELYAGHRMMAVILNNGVWPSCSLDNLASRWGLLPLHRALHLYKADMTQ